MNIGSLVLSKYALIDGAVTETDEKELVNVVLDGNRKMLKLVYEDGFVDEICCFYYDVDDVEVRNKDIIEFVKERYKMKDGVGVRLDDCKDG